MVDSSRPSAHSRSVYGKTYQFMIEIIRTNDPVVLSFAEALLRDAGIDCLVADRNMSIMEGSLGIIARRVLVAEDDEAQARRILRDGGMADEMR